MVGSPQGNSSSTSRMKTEYEVEAEKRAKERKKAFEQRGSKSSYYNTPVEYKQKSGSGAYADVDRNTRIARDLERDAVTKNFLGKTKGDDINIGGIKISPSSLIPGGLFLNKMQEFAYKQQAKELRKGGSIVSDSDGDYVGVMRDGRYSGRPDFDPNRQVESGESTNAFVSVCITA